MSERLTERIGNGIRYDNGEYIVTCYPENENLTPVDKMAVRLCELEDKLPALEMELQAAKETANPYKLHYENLKAEIIREFSDRLYDRAFRTTINDGGIECYTKVVAASEIYDLVREMTEGDDGKE